MKKLRLLVVATLLTAGSTPGLLSSVAHADSKAPKTEQRRGQRGNRMAMMEKELGLTAAQKAKIKPIMEQSQQRMKKVREDKSLSPEQKRAKMKTIHQETWKKINPILTDAQRKKLAEMRQKRGQRSGNWGKR